MYIKTMVGRMKLLIILVLFCLYNVSCVDTRKAVYFVDQKDATFSTGNAVPIGLIQPNDILSINITSSNPEATLIFNTPNTAGTTAITGTGTPTNSFGYLVNLDGNVEIPLLGPIKASGLTKKQLADTITQQLQQKELLVRPIVTIRQLNFRVTVLGEVAKPSVYPVPSEKISLLEALGLAGDITIYARKDNVILLREEGDKKILKRINLNSSELLTSPYYYLKSNDILYVEPNKSRIVSAGNTRNLFPIIASTLSVLIIVIDRVLR